MTATDARMEFFASCPKGFEQLLADELSAMGLPQVRALKGQVSFGQAIGDAYRACLWSRLASRVVLVLARIDATDSDALYDGLSQIAWEDHLGTTSTFAIDAHGTNDELRNTQFVALRSKDAVVDRCFSARGVRPQVNTDAPDVSIVVRVSRNHATVGIDLSGTPLFRRGYEPGRSSRAPIAPLRPDYAAALLAAGGWFRNCRHDRPVLAACFPGAGTILVEAAAQALDRAPGLHRLRWGFTGWGGHDAAAWQALVDEAAARAEAAKERELVLLATESRKGSEVSARNMLHAAGLHLQPRYLAAHDMAQALGGEKNALLVSDTSWVGEGEVALQTSILADVAAVATGAHAMVALSPDTIIDSTVGFAASRTLDVIVGQTDASIRCYEAGAASLFGEAGHPMVDIAGKNGERIAVPVLLAQSDQFAKRIAKVAKLRRKWAVREDVSCYRVYDADLPDYAVSIDLFEGSELMPARKGRGRWLQIYEYAAPKGVDADLARKRLLDVLAIAPRVLGVEPGNVFVRVRTKARGGSQYATEAAAQTGGTSQFRKPSARPGRGQQGSRRLPQLPVGAHLVDEGGLTFEVNFSTRLDCGIFLDHRDTRSMVREMMKETQGSKRFLNLFAYTGTATCYAADGGAKYTTTVDMSRPSLEWAERNMARNGFEGPQHEFVQADVTRWISEQRRTANRWDLVFCDVPTFSNSSRMGKNSWDVQRDHAELLIGLSRLLTRNGRAIFSCNLRNFKPDVEKLERFGVAIEDITSETIPEDFGRNAKIHHCYLVSKAAAPTSGAGTGH